VPKDVLVSRDGNVPIERNYYVCHKQKGDFPKFLDEFTELRLYFKRDNRPEFRAINKVLSDGLKIVLNGGYGCFGYKHFRFLDVRVAELVTAYGRYTLRKLSEIASQHGLDVIYGDTDSLFVEGENATNDEEIKKFIEDANQTLNIELEDDKLFERCIILSKKHYLGVYYDKDNKEYDTIVKGLEGAKSDRPAFINRIHEKFVEDFEANLNPWTSIACELKKLVNKELLSDDFKIEIQLSKNPEEYSQSLIQYKVGTLMNAKAGDLIWYYKIENGDPNRAKALEKKDGGFIAYQNSDNISYEKYLEDVESTFAPLLAHLGLDAQVLFKQFHEEVPKDQSDPFQNTLEGGFGEAAA
jgi:DNA polymerase I